MSGGLAGDLLVLAAVAVTVVAWVAVLAWLGDREVTRGHLPRPKL